MTLDEFELGPIFFGYVDGVEVAGDPGLGAGSLRNGSERDPANTRHTIEPVPLGPIGEFGWEAAIRSSRLNENAER